MLGYQDSETLGCRDSEALCLNLSNSQPLNLSTSYFQAFLSSACYPAGVQQKRNPLMI